MRVGLIRAERGHGYGMPHVVIEVDTDVPPERMMEAATDFSERRPESWPNISREFWQVHDHGPNWAEATEGSPAVWRTLSGTNGRTIVSWARHGLERLAAGWYMDIDRRAAKRFRQSHSRGPGSTMEGQGLALLCPAALFGQQMFKRNLQKTLDVLAASSR